ncbi:MAG: bifunctional phosphoribosyl-AMP cyclohydrolase/phosphoribosyl-ATP diphosphatase HisIE [Bacteroidales bacterium]|nr:bifunctional phosphoribosyl-AMP cyclohydrolase/phosphoribosyl-ATP diphosphatase HisIE [Bacteroidales bacterium]
MELNFSKYADGLIPAIIQDADTRVVLMLGFMNQEAFDKTINTGKVTFYSRTRQTLWTKGETSGNFLNFVDAKVDCDNDTLLIKVHPIGPTCHTGTDTCWAEVNQSDVQLLHNLQSAIDTELKDMPEDSELAKLIRKGGVNKIAQEVGENAIETVIQSTNGSDEKLIEKGADLLYHFVALMSANNIRIDDVIEKIKETRLNK